MSSEPAALAHHFESIEKQVHAERMGMWLFLATEVLLFTALFAAYGVYRFLYTSAFAEASRGLETWMGGVNTFVLVTSSLTVALGLDAAARGQGRRSAALYAASIGMGLVFMALKAVEYRHHFVHGELPGMYYQGHIPGSGGSLFFALYFLITGLHALHVLIGMTVLGVVAVKSWRGRYSASYHAPVELAGLYWHLVDLIWIFVFPLIYLI
ncbi:MAG TPA: cytochrome c oxidase subunit 3 family protein [Anaeromyxobacteraceae bacterium]|nr:cytochrome c oxidase subunit 3 family protein [Anaeromyxobacteraceae bacterium]